MSKPARTGDPIEKGQEGDELREFTEALLEFLSR